MGKSPLDKIEAFKKKEKKNGQCAICDATATYVLMQKPPYPCSFVCTRCSGILRELSFPVKGIKVTIWKEDDSDRICAGGNVVDHREFCAKWDGSELAVNRDSDDAAVRRYIQAKYVDKKWYSSSGGGSSGHHRSGSGGHSSRSGSKSRSSGSSKEDVRRLREMFPDLSEDRAKELLSQHGSVDAAAEAKIMSTPFDSTPSGSSRGKSSERQKSGPRKSSSRRHNHEEPSMSVYSSMQAIDASPAGLGQASPNQVQGMAGMVGMVARGEISPFGSVGQAPPNNGYAPYGSGQQFGSGGWNQPPPSGGGWGSGQFASPPQHSPQGAFGCDGSAGPWQNQQQAPNPFSTGQQTPPMSNASNPFASQSGATWGQQNTSGWGQQPSSPQQQMIMQQLEQKKKQLQELLQQQQMQQMHQQIPNGFYQQPQSSMAAQGPPPAMCGGMWGMQQGPMQQGWR